MLYADNTQLHLVMRRNDLADDISTLEDCETDMKACASNTNMVLNAKKDWSHPHYITFIRDGNCSIYGTSLLAFT